MLELQFSSNPKELEKLLFQTKKKLEDTRLLLKTIGTYMVGSIAMNFVVEGRPEKWLPLSPSTINRRRGGGVGIRILRDTGRLARSINFKVIGDSEVRIGTNVSYAHVHQFGANILNPSRTIHPRHKQVLKFSIAGVEKYAKKVNLPAFEIKIPQRKFLLFQKQDIEEISKMFSRHVEKSLK